MNSLKKSDKSKSKDPLFVLKVDKKYKVFYSVQDITRKKLTLI